MREEVCVSCDQVMGRAKRREEARGAPPTDLEAVELLGLLNGAWEAVLQGGKG